MKIQALFFDLDGTLIHSEPTAARVLGEVFREWKLELDPADAQVVTGRTWELAFQFLLGKYTLPVSREDALRIVLDRYRRELKQGFITVPGAVEAVEDLAQAFPLALVSGSNREEILYALDRMKILPHFQVILGAEDYPRSKPAPDGYEKALEMLSLSRGEALVFEDSEAGIASAQAAGLPVVAVSCTNHHHQIQTSADWIIQDLTQVNRAWLNALKRP